MEKEGKFFGLPENDNIALQEFKSLHDMGAKYLVYGWPCFWWMEYDEIFTNYINSHYACIEKTDRLIVFELT